MLLLRVAETSKVFVMLEEEMLSKQGDCNGGCFGKKILEGVRVWSVDKDYLYVSLRQCPFM
jgi:hypothetical protein